MNLEALWLGGNKLQAITGLDANFRIRALHVNVSVCEERCQGAPLPFLASVQMPTA